MYRGRTVRELQRFHRQELERRDEMIQSLLDRLQHPERVPIWREQPTQDELAAITSDFDQWVTDPDQLPTYGD